MKTIATFLNLQDAYLLQIRLESEGVKSLVTDEMTASMIPHLTNLIGGIKVQVMDSDYARALALLQEEQIPPVNLRDDLTCPRCGSTDIYQDMHKERYYLLSFLILILMMLPVPLIKKRFRCKTCKHLWKEKKGKVNKQPV